MDYINILSEPQLVHDIDKEYLKLINYYSQIQRSSIFIEYYNINSLVSSYEENLFSTYNDDNLRFDVFRLTPLYSISPISNSSQNDTNVAGDSLTGETSIVINTIKEPKINDLIRFYPPHEKSKEIFRVSQISTISYSIHADPNVTWFNLTLEYAPRETLKNLNIHNKYIFDLSTNQNIEYTIYENKIKKLSTLDIILKKLKPLYSPNLDLYYMDNKIPFILNNNIWKIKSEYNELNQYKKPYGFKTITKIDLPCDLFLNLDSHYYNYFNLLTNQIETYYFEDLNNIKNDFELMIKNSLDLVGGISGNI